MIFKSSVKLIPSFSVTFCKNFYALSRTYRSTGSAGCTLAVIYFSVIIIYYYSFFRAFLLAYTASKSTVFAYRAGDLARILRKTSDSNGG